MSHVGNCLADFYLIHPREVSSQLIQRIKALKVPVIYTSGSTSHLGFRETIHE